MKLPVVSDLDVAGRNVIVRADLEWESEGCPRQIATEKIVEYLKLRGAVRVKVIGHKGHWHEGLIEVINNLRDDPREERNDVSMANELADGFDVYINEAFATSHRKHCSIDALPILMRTQNKDVAIGLRFAKELKMLSGLESGVLVIGGAKISDKAVYADKLEQKGWKVLRGGLLSGVELREDGLDVSDKTIIQYIEEIKNAQTIVVAGPMGKYEDENASRGTKEVYEAVSASVGKKIAGGGDTEAALTKFGLAGKFDWISVGGGAMLEYLTTGTLVGLEAIQS